MDGIIGLGAGINYILQEGMDKIRKYEEELTKHFIEEVTKLKKSKFMGH